MSRDNNDENQNDSQRSEKNPYDVPISGHDYDGIQELDNPLPNWWLYTFFGTIIFGAIYWIHYQTGAGPSLDEELAMRLERIEQLRAEQTVSIDELNEDQLIAMIGDPNIMERAASSYNLRCAACHGMSGEGGIGAALNDGVWVHGGDIRSVYRVIAEGVIDKGMPPWKDILNHEEILELIAYIRTFE